MALIDCDSVRPGVAPKRLSPGRLVKTSFPGKGGVDMVDPVLIQRAELNLET